MNYLFYAKLSIEFYMKTNLRLILPCLIVSLTFLLVATKSSPLYPMNDWVDANAIFTVGKGMMIGDVVYKDLFEQKGPLLYLIHGIGYLFSNNSHTGLFAMEVLFFTLFLFYALKTIRLYIGERLSLISLPLLGFTILNLKNFTHGDSAEEYCMAFLMISLYHIVKYFKQHYPKKMDFKVLLLNGFLAGCILWIKYSMLGFWFGWMLFVFIMTLWSKEYKYAIISCFAFLLGMVVSSLPWFAYFGYHDAISDFLESYFLINIKYYSADGSLFDHLFNALYYVKNYLLDNPIFTLFALTGFAMLVFTKKMESSWNTKLGIIVSFGFLFLGVYGGGVTFIYYFLILSPVVIFGVIAVLKLIEDYLAKKSKTIPLHPFLNTLIILLLLVGVTWKTHHNSYFLGHDREDLFQYKFASIIKKDKNPSLLNYGFLDLGVHFASNVPPKLKHFQTQNIDYNKYPVNIDAQNEYIGTQATTFVVVRKDPFFEKHKKHIETYYELVSSEQQFFEGKNYTYLLFKVKT